jgi:hypothetical protein
LRTEIQYRAKDPDNTCGNNCDPQSCTTDNPPVCTPYPSNINDPVCNPNLGGNPNAAECLDGSHAGLVCTLSAVPLASGTPGGTFINPQDGVTPVGPILPVNLNLAAGIPGIILPGLGGPAGSNAENSPAYPGLPNANGALPPLIYLCDPAIPGGVAITLVCSDGDLDCDQSKQIEVFCSVGDFCVGLPPDFCAAPGECLSGGTGAETSVPGCDQLCDPNDPYNTGSPGNGPPCEQCPNQGDPLPDGTPCSVGVCNGGICDSSCPVFTKVLATPLQANVGDSISVSAEASSYDGGALDYQWTASAGSFADPTLATTTYLCEQAGEQTLTIAVANANGSCGDESTLTVTCLSP